MENKLQIFNKELYRKKKVVKNHLRDTCSFQLIFYNTILNLRAVYMWKLCYKSTFATQTFSTKFEVIHNIEHITHFVFFNSQFIPSTMYSEKF